jgi:hypothetical protein
MRALIASFVGVTNNSGIVCGTLSVLRKSLSMTVRAARPVGGMPSAQWRGRRLRSATLTAHQSASGGTRMRRRGLIAVLVVVALASAPSLASASAHSAAPTAKVAALVQGHEASLVAVPKFIFHAGLAFGAFHHFIYLPYKAGKFTKGGFLSKLKTYAEAGLAALFVYHEVKLALKDAQQNKALKVLVSPLTGLAAVFGTIVAKVKAHGLDNSTITSVQNSVTSVESQAKSAGSSISEVIPSATQLATGSA